MTEAEKMTLRMLIFLLSPPAEQNDVEAFQLREEARKMIERAEKSEDPLRVAIRAVEAAAPNALGTDRVSLALDLLRDEEDYLREAGERNERMTADG